MILIFSILVYQAYCQSCRLLNTQGNLISVAEDETHVIKFSDYFVGESLIFSLNKKFSYFQASSEVGPGKVINKVISLISFKNKGHYALVQGNDGENIFYQINKMQQELTKEIYSFSNQITKRVYSNCYQIIQFKNFLLMACLNQDLQEYKELELHFFEQKNTFSVPITLKYKLSQKNQKIQNIKVQSGNDFLGILIKWEEVTDWNLCVIKVNKQNSELTQILELEEILSYKIVNNFLFFIRNGYNGFEYYDFEEKQIIQISQNKEIDDQFFGISLIAYKNINTIYQISLWNENKIILFIWNYEQPENIYQLKEYQTTQITIENNFNTDVYIDNKYLIISNLNGISIYPSIYNNQNNGLQLYYYNVQSQFSSYDTINQILVSIQPEGVYTYFIQDYQLQLSNLKITLNVQKFHLYAKTNQFNKPSVDCPELILYFQVTKNPLKTNSAFIGEQFYSDEENETVFKILIQQTKKQEYFGVINLKNYFFGPNLKINTLILKDLNNKDIIKVKTKQQTLKAQSLNFFYVKYFDLNRKFYSDINDEANYCYYMLTITQEEDWDELNFNLHCETQNKEYQVVPIFKKKSLYFILKSQILKIQNIIYLCFINGSNGLLNPTIELYKFELVDDKYKLISQIQRKFSKDQLQIQILRLELMDHKLLVFIKMFSIQFNFPIQIFVADLDQYLVGANFQLLEGTQNLDIMDVKFEEQEFKNYFFAIIKILDKYLNEYREALIIYIIEEDKLKCLGEIRNKPKDSHNINLQMILNSDGLFVQEIQQSTGSLYFYPSKEIKKILVQFNTGRLSVFFEDIPRLQLPYYYHKGQIYATKQCLYIFNDKPEFQIIAIQLLNGNLVAQYYEIILEKQFKNKISLFIETLNDKEIFLVKESTYYKFVWDQKQLFDMILSDTEIDFDKNYYLDFNIYSNINEQSKKEKFQSKIKVQFEKMEINEQIHSEVNFLKE